MGPPTYRTWTIGRSAFGTDPWCCSARRRRHPLVLLRSLGRLGREPQPLAGSPGCRPSHGPRSPRRAAGFGRRGASSPGRPPRSARGARVHGQPVVDPSGPRVSRANPSATNTRVMRKACAAPFACRQAVFCPSAKSLAIELPRTFTRKFQQLTVLSLTSRTLTKRTDSGEAIRHGFFASREDPFFR
jgi:hypothetical protein